MQINIMKAKKNYLCQITPSSHLQTTHLCHHGYVRLLLTNCEHYITTLYRFTQIQIFSLSSYSKQKTETVPSAIISTKHENGTVTTLPT